MATVTSTAMYLRDDPETGLDVLVKTENYGPPGEFLTVAVVADGNEVSLRGQRGVVIGLLQSMLHETMHATPSGEKREVDVHLGREAASETCPVCGQPDNCGDCDHTPVPPEMYEHEVVVDLADFGVYDGVGLVKVGDYVPTHRSRRDGSTVELVALGYEAFEHLFIGRNEDGELMICAYSRWEEIRDDEASTSEVLAWLAEFDAWERTDFDSSDTAFELAHSAHEILRRVSGV